METHFSLQNSEVAKYPLLKKILEKILFFPQLTQIIKNSEAQDSYSLLETLFHQLNIKLDYSPLDLAKIPTEGPVIVAANHPFGVADAAALMYLLLKIRPDTKALANYYIGNCTPFGSITINIDPFQNNTISKCNIHGIKEAKKWLLENKLLAIFPAGIVAHWQFKFREVRENAWHPIIEKLAQQTNATIVPWYFHGKNSWYFQLAGLISPFLRTLLLPQQIFTKQNKTIFLTIGHPITPNEYSPIPKKELTHYLQQRTLLLRYRAKIDKKLLTPLLPIDCEVDESLIIKEIEQLPPDTCIVNQGEFAVYICTANLIPNVLHEIGRLREITFRESGEGTNQLIDLDSFDSYYLHVFLWNKHFNKIAGAYRLGLTDLILPKYGKKGLYISTLYKISDDFFKEIGPAIEMGRSFVTKEFQKKPQSLVLIWKAIVKFMEKNPHYRSLYGAMSISQLYSDLSRDLIVRFFSQHAIHHHLCNLVRAKKPYKIKEKIPEVFSHLLMHSSNLNDLNSWVSDIEFDGKGIPILLKHYHAMASKMIGFNIDEEFNNTLDCLFLSYINDIPHNKMNFYMGKENFEKYRNYPR